MAEIYLMHPKHGVKIATMEMEAQYDESNGWMRFDPADLADEMTDKPSDAPVDLPDAEVEANVFQRRRGRPRLSKSE